ncbi:hypothetical protein [Xenorhabdus sp. Sc-CR9]|uniref:hypothetical protein n=1 Tax=Xenorhabdus sp. Sc-CR9 TaxID=2584468 RepID=UPI001F1FFE34|nr:hypothetical protein [Xenorhabdus sp. Sc-CR9]
MVEAFIQHFQMLLLFFEFKQEFLNQRVLDTLRKAPYQGLVGIGPSLSISTTGLLPP